MTIFDRMVFEIRSAKSNEQKSQRIEVMLDYCKEALSHCKNAAERMEVLLEVAYLLHDNPQESRIWNWLHDVSKTTDEALRESLTIAIFEPITEKPRTVSHTKRLWEFWINPQTRWVVETAYRSSKRLKEIDGKKFLKR